MRKHLHTLALVTGALLWCAPIQNITPAELTAGKSKLKASQTPAELAASKTGQTDVALKNFAASLETLTRDASKLSAGKSKPPKKKAGSSDALKVKLKNYESTDLLELINKATTLASGLGESGLGLLKKVGGGGKVMDYLERLNKSSPQLIVPLAKIIEKIATKDYLQKAVELITLLDCLPKKPGLRTAKLCKTLEDDYKKTPQGQKAVGGAPMAVYLKRILEVGNELLQPFTEFGIDGFYLNDEKYDGMLMVAADLTPEIAKEVKMLAELFSTLTKILAKIGEGIKV